MITTVSNATDLTAALKAAHSGDTIQLAPGVYSPFAVRGLHLDGEVTITSKDPGNQAVLTGFNLREVDGGLTIKNVELTVDPKKADNPFVVMASKDVHFDHLNVHGSLDGNPQNDQGALLIRTSTGISVTNSEFQQVEYAITHLDNDGLTVSGNTFHDIRTDGIRGGGSSHVTITQNTFTDFYPVKGDHPDAIQFWTGNTTASAHDITVSGNLVFRGDGQATQGIFMRDEAGGLPFQHVTIANNVMIGTQYNSISVQGGKDIVIDHNTLSGFTGLRSWIRLEYVDGASVKANAVNLIYTTATDAHIVQTGNTIIPLLTDNGVAAYQDWLLHHASGVTPPGAGQAGTLTGTSGADTLTGRDGVDVLSGGAGNDVYVIATKPSIVEGAAGGMDTVRASLSYSLPSNVENLVFTGLKNLWGGGNELNNSLVGNAGPNHLSGNAGADTLNGGAGADVVAGGSGNDLLIGGAGADTFVFSRGDGSDVIKDFGAGGQHDALDLSAFLDAGLKPILTDATAGVTISFTSGEEVLLQGVHIASLHATTTGFLF
jgi:Ca2+-binding RTX toxin-like protein